jgi:hypothetical protein
MKHSDLTMLQNLPQVFILVFWRYLKKPILTGAIWRNFSSKSNKHSARQP